jgi:hypothetical protein
MPATYVISESQFKTLLAAAQARASAAPAAPAVTPEQARVNEAAELRSLTSDQLSARLLQRLAETWVPRSPGWRAPITETAQPQGLAEQAQAIPAGLHSVSLTEAMAARHDLHSPLWTRPAGVGHARTIFDA